MFVFYSAKQVDKYSLLHIWHNTLALITLVEHRMQLHFAEYISLVTCGDLELGVSMWNMGHPDDQVEQGRSVGTVC